MRRAESLRNEKAPQQRWSTGLLLEREGASPPVTNMKRRTSLSLRDLSHLGSLRNRFKRGLSNGGGSVRSPEGTLNPAHHHHHHHHHSFHHTTTIIVHKDDRGYGMKVSGDNPVFVQSVKEGGAAERAGLHSGDTIVKVNGVDVTHSTHTEVVELIKSGSQVVLTVQQSPLPLMRERSGSNVMASPNLHHTRHHSLQSRDRITGPQPVDHEKMRQLEFQRVHTLRLMLEKEQLYMDTLRSKLAKCTDPIPDPKLQQDLSGAERRVLTLQQQLMALVNPEGLDSPPPLPHRNPPRPSPSSPPPLPPRQYLLYPASGLDGPSPNSSAASTNHTGAAGPQVHTHQRTKSSPDTLTTNLSLAEASKRLIASESMSELNFPKRSKGEVIWDLDSPRITPPGTPPPPYGGSQATSEEPDNSLIEEESRGEVTQSDLSDTSPLKTAFVNYLGQGSGQVQQPIISMEDEDMLSDPETSQFEDHGPFKSLSKLWLHPAHLAVFLNYVLSNSDPSSLLFYLVTDLYREGNAKEMKKWAYEIHSSFLVPGAPLRLSNVDENVAREIDDVLLKESDKEEILRKIFWKARMKAKEELNEQLADFQAKRTAGLGTLFGPSDSILDESIHDKSKETKIIESILIPKMEPYLEDIERDIVDDKRFSTGAALGTVMGKVFGLRGPHFSSLLDRCPTYVSKDKSLKAKLIGKTRKVTVRGHHCVAHQYYTVTYCNHCQLIIWGIGPQGYQCSNCGLNIHRNCVKVLEESCPGPMVKKEKGNDRISKLMERIRPENARRKPSSLNLAQVERSKRLQEEEPGVVMDNEIGERGGGRGQTERRPDPVRETEERGTRTAQDPEHNNIQDLTHHVTKSKPSTASINRSESYKERIHQKRQLRERRKTSDPNLSKTNNDVELDTQVLSYYTNSGSSSNSSLSTRSLESPSTSLEAVSGGVGVAAPMWDSDTEAEPDPPDWTKNVPEEVLVKLSAQEKKRQEIINELFHTERSHVRGLKVLDQVFFRPMRDQQILPPDQIELLFSNLEEMLVIHAQFNNLMKAKRKENPVVCDIGTLLITMFEGETFQRAAATFCARQQIALEALRERRRKDPKLHNFLNDAEMNPVCRRLQLKDIIPTGWLRLTKYPLLLENLAKHTPNEGEESLNLQWAIERSKDILNHVDKAVKEALDEHRLAEIQRRLDKTPFDKVDHHMAMEFRNLDLTKHRLIYEGALNWRISNRPKPIDVHVLLLEDVIVLLQKQDEKYVLKFYSPSLSPVIKVSTVLVRPNAVDKKGLYLVNTSQNGAQIYDLVATSSSEKRTWFKHISDAAEAYKQREGKNRRPEPSIPSSTDLDASESVHDKTKENEESGEGNSSEIVSPGRSSGADQDSPGSGNTPLPSSESTPQASPAPHTPEPTASKLGDGILRRGEESLRLTTESALIEPSEVLISQRDVLTAEPVLTPLEKLRRKDEDIRQALMEKQALVADILHVPRDEFETIAELAGEPAADKEATELVLAAVNQANQLSLILNEALQLNEEEAVSATSEVTGGNPRSQRLPAVPAHRLQGIASALNAHLTQLMNIMTERDDERERLRRELQRSREQLHALHERPNPNGPSIIQEELAPLPSEQTSSPEVFVDALSGEVEGPSEVVE